jgi:hypothetical protein
MGCPLNKNSTTVLSPCITVYVLIAQINFFTKVYVLAMAVLKVFLTLEYITLMVKWLKHWPTKQRIRVQISLKNL